MAFLKIIFNIKRGSGSRLHSCLWTDAPAELPSADVQPPLGDTAELKHVSSPAGSSPSYVFGRISNADLI